MSWQAGSRRDRRGRDATLLVLAFPFGNHTKVSPSILPRAGGPPRPASSPQVGPAGLRVGRAALYPRTWRLGMLEQPPCECWGRPKRVAWGNPWIPIPTRSPWPWGSPVAEVVTGFTLLYTPRTPLCPRTALGHCWARRCVPAASTTWLWDPRRAPGGRGAGGRAGRLSACWWQPWLPRSGRERVSQQRSPTQHPQNWAHVPGHRALDGASEEGASRRPESQGSSTAPGDVASQGLP